MKRTTALRAVALAGLLAATAGVSTVAIGVSSAGAAATVTGAYNLNFDWSGYPPPGSMTIKLTHRYRIFVDRVPAGFYSYEHHVLTLNTMSVPDCGAVYTGTGSKSGGFSGTMIIENSVAGCLPQGTTGTWSASLAVGSANASHSGVSMSGQRISTIGRP